MLNLKLNLCCLDKFPDTKYGENVIIYQDGMLWNSKKGSITYLFKQVWSASNEWVWPKRKKECLCYVVLIFQVLQRTSVPEAWGKAQVWTHREMWI